MNSHPEYLRDIRFDSTFDKITNLKWYPYVGERYVDSTKKLLVFAHNIPSPPDEYEMRMAKWKDKDYWAKCMREYTFEEMDHNKTFRYFIKGAVGLKGDYHLSSGPDIIKKIDTFIATIAYINFIQDLVVCEQSIRGVATPGQVENSKQINRKIIDAISPTHCICWGRHVFEYVLSLPGACVVTRCDYSTKGFSYAEIILDTSRRLHVLKTFHPSMPGFKVYSNETQKTIREFIEMAPHP